MQSVDPAPALAHIVSGAGGHDRDRQEAHTDDACREQHAGGPAGQGLQGPRRVGCRVDGMPALAKQRRCCGQHDEVHHHAGKQHTEQDIPEARPQGRLGRPAPLSEAALPGGDFLFHLLIRLPGVEVRRKRGADDRDQDCQQVAIQPQMGHQRPLYRRREPRMRQQR